LQNWVGTSSPRRNSWLPFATLLRTTCFIPESLARFWLWFTALNRAHQRLQSGDYFVTSAMKTPKGSSFTSVFFAEECGVATRLFNLAEAKPLSARLKVAFWGEADMFSATSTAFPL